MVGNIGKEERVVGGIGRERSKGGVILGKKKGWVMGGIGRERRKGGGNIGKEERA